MFYLTEKFQIRQINIVNLS